jgi:hypothetical protein
METQRDDDRHTHHGLGAGEYELLDLASVEGEGGSAAAEEVG